MSSAESPVAKYIIAAVVILGVPAAVVAWRLANPPAPAPITAVPVASTTQSTSRVELEVSSPTQGAQVSVAGEKHSLPWTGDLLSGNSETEIELTAPGHAGRRFRVVMDRPRRLSFALPPGSGVANASLEELDQALNSDDDLLALGADAGEDAGARRAAAIARRAAAAAGATTTTPTATAAPTATATAVATATATATATAAPTATETAAPVATQATPAVAPGTVDPKGVRMTIKAHMGEVQNCVERARMDTPNIVGRMIVEASVAPTGQAQSARVTSTDIRSPRLESCLTAAFQSWTFPAPAGGVPGTVSYPFNFKE